MNIEYSNEEFNNGQDDAPIHIDNKVDTANQFNRIMHYAIRLNQFFGAKQMPKEHTTSVKGLDIPKLATDSPAFREIIESGMYALIGDRIYLYSPDVMKSGKDINTIVLNDRIKKAPEKYCLTVAGESLEEIVETKQYGKLSFYHPEKSEKLQQTGVVPENFTLSLRDVLARSIDSGSQINATESTSMNPLEYFIKERAREKQISLRRLSEEIMISERTIERFWRKPNARPALNNVVAVCIGLEMNPAVSRMIIELAGYTLRNVPLERAYIGLLCALYTEGIQVCNQVLLHNHLEALTPAT